MSGNLEFEDGPNSWTGNKRDISEKLNWLDYSFK